MKRVISPKQLILISVLYCLSPIVIRKLVVGSITGPFYLWLPELGSLLAYLSITLGALLLAVYLLFWCLPGESWQPFRVNWIDITFLWGAFLLFFSSSTTVYANSYLYPYITGDYEREFAFQWIGELAATQTLLLIFTITVPALFGVLPDQGGYRIINFGLQIALLVLRQE